MEYEKLLTLKEAAELISISIHTLYNWRSAGIISRDKRYKVSYILGIREKWIKNKLVA